MEIELLAFIARHHDKAGTSIKHLLGRGGVVEAVVGGALDKRCALTCRKARVIHAGGLHIDYAAASRRGGKNIHFAISLVEQQHWARVIVGYGSIGRGRPRAIRLTDNQAHQWRAIAAAAPRITE